MTRPCPHCKGAGVVALERSASGVVLGWVKCRPCRGKGVRASVSALNEAVKGNTRA